MEKLQLEDKLFHAIKPHILMFNTANHDEYKNISYNKIIKKIKGILKSGFIMCRKDLISSGQCISFSSKNFNGENNVSLSKHFSKKYEDNEKYTLNSGEEDAWTDFPFNYPAVVFSPRLFSFLSEDINSMRISLETQVKGSIPIKYAEAISIPETASIAPFFGDNTNFEKCLEYYKSNKYDYILLKHILYLLKQYSIALPIISIDTGAVYQPNEKYDYAIKKQLSI